MTAPVEITPVILSGGSGTRLWPLSRELYPKQLISFAGGHTLLQETVKRFEGFASDNIRLATPVIVCGEDSRFMVMEQLEQAGLAAWTIILEPEGRNTAPALTIAARHIMDAGKDTIMLVIPADHVIRDTAAFHSAIRRGVELVLRRVLVTFGVTVKKPETGYGYIRAGKTIAHEANGLPQADSISAFVEKPDAGRAREYAESGCYLWNSGIFMMTASQWMEEIKNHRPDIYSTCADAYAQGKTDRFFRRVEPETFKRCPSDSIDYAVIEKMADDGSDRAAVVHLDAGWSDIGTWPALWDILPKDGCGNAGRGDVFTEDVHDSLLFAEDHFLAVVGMKDIIVIETADAVLVANKSHSQNIRKVVEWLKSKNRAEHLVHRRVYRPWGTYETIAAGERYQVKRITVKPGAALSLQKHHRRAEHWVVVKGTARVTRGEDVFMVSENQSTYIPLGEVHRLENPGTILLELIEVQSGGYLGEDDIVRLEDRYQRHFG